MSLRDWDRKVELLQTEVSALLVEKSERKLSQEAEGLLKKMRRIKKWQFRLEKNLAFLFSMVRRKHFLSMHEKTLLHWAREFTEKTGSHYRDYISALNTLLWAKLVQARSMSITYDNQADLGDANEAELIRAYQNQMQHTKGKLEGYLATLKDKKAVMRQRYEALVVAYVNEEAHAYLRASSSLLTPVSPHVLTFRESLALQGGEEQGQLLARMQRESSKLTRLTLRRQGARRPAAEPHADQRSVAGQGRSVEHLLEKFDYMNLDASLTQLEQSQPSRRSPTW